MKMSQFKKLSFALVGGNCHEDSPPSVRICSWLGFSFRAVRHKKKYAYLVYIRRLYNVFCWRDIKALVKLMFATFFQRRGKIQIQEVYVWQYRTMS